MRLEFANGCVANLTASRVSTDRVRKLRLFQPRQYLSLDYGRQDLAVVGVGPDRQIGFEQVAVAKAEPLARRSSTRFWTPWKRAKPPKTSRRGRTSNTGGRAGDS